MKAKKTKHKVGDTLGRESIFIKAYDARELSSLYWGNGSSQIDSQWRYIVMAGSSGYYGRGCDDYKHECKDKQYES